MGSCFLLVDGVLEEGPGAEMGVPLDSVVGVLVSLPKTNSVLSAATSQGSHSSPYTYKTTQKKGKAIPR